MLTRPKGSMLSHPECKFLKKLKIPLNLLCKFKSPKSRSQICCANSKAQTNLLCKFKSPKSRSRICCANWKAQTNLLCKFKSPKSRPRICCANSKAQTNLLCKFKSPKSRPRICCANWKAQTNLLCKFKSPKSRPRICCANSKAQNQGPEFVVQIQKPKRICCANSNLQNQGPEFVAQIQKQWFHLAAGSLVPIPSQNCSPFQWAMTCFFGLHILDVCSCQQPAIAILGPGSWGCQIAHCKCNSGQRKSCIEENSASTIAVKKSLPKTNVLPCTLQALRYLMAMKPWGPPPWYWTNFPKVLAYSPTAPAADILAILPKSGTCWPRSVCWALKAIVLSNSTSPTTSKQILVAFKATWIRLGKLLNSSLSAMYIHIYSKQCWKLRCTPNQTTHKCKNIYIYAQASSKKKGITVQVQPSWMPLRNWSSETNGHFACFGINPINLWRAASCRHGLQELADMCRWQAHVPFSSKNRSHKSGMGLVKSHAESNLLFSLNWIWMQLNASWWT